MLFSVEEWQWKGAGATKASAPTTTGCTAALPRTDQETLKSRGYNAPTREGTVLLGSEGNYINIYILLWYHLMPFVCCIVFADLTSRFLWECVFAPLISIIFLKFLHEVIERLEKVLTTKLKERNEENLEKKKKKKKIFKEKGVSTWSDFPFYIMWSSNSSLKWMHLHFKWAQRQHCSSFHV